MNDLPHNYYSIGMFLPPKYLTLTKAILVEKMKASTAKWLERSRFTQSKVSVSYLICITPEKTYWLPETFFNSMLGKESEAEKPDFCLGCSIHNIFSLFLSKQMKQKNISNIFGKLRCV